MSNDKRIVLVTGGSSGYGKETARLFALQGDTVIITGRDASKLLAAREETGCTDFFAADATHYDDWTALHDYVMEKYGRLDILVNNAGGGVAIKSVAEQSRAEIDRAIALNLNSVIYGCSVFAKTLMGQRSGTIVNVSSVCATHAWPAWSVYASAKAGVLAFSKGLYVELQPYRVRVSCVIPAAATTGFNQSAGLADGAHELLAEDVARTIVNICSMPDHAVVEEVTVWGIDQVVNPL